MLADGSIMSWWMKTRQPIGFKRPHPFGSQANGKGLGCRERRAILDRSRGDLRNILVSTVIHPARRIAALERTYRSTKPLLAAANAVMDLAEDPSPRTSGLSARRRAARLVSFRDVRADQPRYYRRNSGEPRAGIFAQNTGSAVQGLHQRGYHSKSISPAVPSPVKFAFSSSVEPRISDVLAFLRWVG